MWQNSFYLLITLIMIYNIKMGLKNPRRPFREWGKKIYGKCDMMEKMLEENWENG